MVDKAGVCVDRAVQEEVVAGVEARVGWAGGSPGDKNRLCSKEGAWSGEETGVG